MSFTPAPLRTKSIASLPGLAYEETIFTQVEEVLEDFLREDRKHLTIFPGVPSVLAKHPPFLLVLLCPATVFMMDEVPMSGKSLSWGYSHFDKVQNKLGGSKCCNNS